MKSVFPGYFRPTPEEFSALWANCLFAVDANVLLNLYRYSPAARQGLTHALDSVRERVFMPHHAAKEFLRNRLSVTAGQAEEYSRAIKQLNDIAEVLANNKKHPFLPDSELPTFKTQTTIVCEQLESQRSHVLERLNHDEILNYVDGLFEHATGEKFDSAKLKAIESEGELRYKNEVPPGYKDGKKDGSGDPYRKFGDLIIWKQLIEKAKTDNKAIIFITDDKKEDWWLEQSGRTIGPRPELIEEFFQETGRKFWMYSVDKFLEELARSAQVEVSQAVIAEVIEVSADTREMSVAEEEEDELEQQEFSPNSAFLAPMDVSNELAAIVGSKPIPRTEIVRRLWLYIKKNNLQDRFNKRMINADEKLYAIFGKSQVSMFEMAGLISKHVR